MAGVETELKALMLLSLAGDKAAYMRLLAALSRYMRGYFSRRLGGPSADVEDLVQETLLAIHLKRDSYDPSLPFTPWAYAMARYKLLDHFRRTGAHKTVPLENAEALFAVQTTDEAAVRADLAKLLAGLPEPQRTLLHDVKISGLSLREAADKSGLSVGAVKLRLHRALKRLSQAAAHADR